jgi:hypothetical protein
MSNLDNRKRKEELQEVVQEAVAETAPEEIVNEEVPSSVESIAEEPKEEPKEVKEVEQPKPSVDYKEKYSESSKEALTQYFKNKKLTSVIEESNSLPEPTDEEMVIFARSKGTNYDELDDFSKGMLKEVLWSKKKTDKVNEIVKESRNMDDWADKVVSFTESVEVAAKYPLVEEHAEDFRRFCMRNQRIGMDLEDLATSFLYGLASMPVKKPTKGSVLLSGGGGVAEEKPAGLTDEDAKHIRETNPKEYRRLIKQGKIRLEI